MSNLIAIVGRPNVGKSTFFNRLIGRRQAIIHGTSGVTRDRHYGQTEWNGQTYSVVDTGGYVTNSDDVFEAAIRQQVQLAIDEADVIFFMVDNTTGLTDLDQQVARMLLKTKKEVFLVVNKVDEAIHEYQAAEFYALGLGDYYAISSINGRGTGELLDALSERVETAAAAENTTTDIPKVAVVGRPNVGKSSFVNALLGDERNIVTPIAGTTRDSIHTTYNKYGKKMQFIDTAGLRKKSKVRDDLEFYSVMRSVRAIEHADISVLMIDAEEGIQSQDINIYRVIQKNHNGVVIVVNKWDLVANKEQEFTKMKAALLKKIEPFTDVPIIFTSVQEKQRIHKVLDTIYEVYENRSRQIQTAKLNEYLLAAIEKYPPPAHKGKLIKIKYATQLKTRFPAFALFCNRPQYIKEPYKRYLENQLRQKFDFHGVPINLYFRKK